MIRHDFECRGYGIDFIERINSTLGAGQRVTGPGRKQGKRFDESLLSQLLAVHKACGGADPVGIRKADEDHVEETLLSNPFMTFRDYDEVDEGECAPSNAAEESTSPRVASSCPNTSDGTVACCGPELGPVVMQRPSDRLALAELSVPKGLRRRGLSVFLMERNKFMKAAKESNRGPLKLSQVKDLHVHFKEMWSQMSQRTSFKDAFSLWQETEKTVKLPVPEYITIWGAGSFDCPIPSNELFDYLREFGWPSDDEVNDLQEDWASVAEEYANIDYTRSAATPLFGRGRWARSGNRLGVERNFEFIEKGVFSMIDRIGKAVVDEADTLVMFEGTTKATPSRTWRVATFITGTTYSPRVWDVCVNAWVKESDENSPILELPSVVHVEMRESLISEDFCTFDTRMGDVFISKLVAELVNVDLYYCDYRALEYDEDNLLYNEISKTWYLGRLWEPGQTNYLRVRMPWEPELPALEDFRKKVERASKRMKTSDPFEEPVTGKKASKRRRTQNAAPAGKAERKKHSSAEVNGPCVLVDAEGCEEADSHALEHNDEGELGDF